jgi:hypothetical protein
MNRQAAIVRRLLGPAEPEVLCDECFDRLDAYVELELRGPGAGEKMPGMRSHLDGCEACREEYEALRELVAGPRGAGAATARR